MENFNINDLNIFAQMDSDTSLAILLIMLGAYLLGFFTGWVARGRKVRSLKATVKAKETALQEQQAKLDELHNEVQQKEESFRKLKIDLDESFTRHQVLEADKQQLKIDRDRIIDDHRKLKTSNQAYADTINDLNAQLTNMKERESKLVANLQQTKDTSSDVAQLQQLYNATRNKLLSLENKINRLEVDNASLRSSTITTNDDLAPASLDEQSVLAKPNEKRILSQRLEPEANIPKDDLTLINGIGPFIEKKLNSIGVFTYEDISNWSDADVEQVTKDIQFFPGRIKQDNWVGQAATLKQANGGFNAPVTMAASEDPKDLKIIEGIGTKTEGVLKEGGIRNWVELANADVAQLKTILKAKGTPYDILDPSTWPEQARLAANAEWERLKQYQDYLIGGRE